RVNDDLGRRLDNGPFAVWICEIEDREIQRRQLMPLQDLPEVGPQLALGAGDYDPHACPFCNRLAYCCW
ncbi:MAG: hypothetical protein K0S58_3598, partial [Nitrospira sp.]|nr:hypothetical protein [Nitrospira sp.]